ncbi:hypothetical protein LAZ67_16000605 [Cordylochernes scorpioides]|uniref:HTH CENPB-type domain-containing protein n=1 Tax=Cordylochernes scorpioides TaxID=51811 RepID=A0ABY6LBK4_9ARAC|nr:hypothetical protein LAZ67_16000605 [Cordylochernes scorpioides]
MLQKGINPNYCRYRQCHYPLLEEALYTWLVQARLKNIPLNGLILQQKALYYAMDMKYDEFEASNGWLDRFKTRRNIIFRKICGEERAVNPLVVEDWKEKIPSFLDKYSPSNIYNIDESGLFYKCLPDKTLTFKGDTCSGTKRSKERITFLAGTNMDGSDKLPLLVIGKYAKPRCFRKEKNLSTHYEANKIAWMTAVILKKYLHYLDEYFGSENKKVLLILDNCPAHHLPEKLENIQVVFLPLNATAKLQPMDMGIILDIKRKYRMKLIQRCLIDMEKDRETNITLLDSIELLNMSWNSVPKSTIVNCFSLSGFGTFQAEIAPQESTNFLSLEEISRATSNFEQYVHVDDNEQVFAEMTDEEIIKMVTNVPDIDLPEEEEEEEMPSSSQVLSSLKWLKTYSRICDFTAEEILKNEDFFARYETKFLRNMLKQKKITDFFNNTQSRHHAHTQELTTEEIQELQSQQYTEVMQVIGFEESEEEVISTSEIKEILGMWERVSQFVEKKQPEKVATGRASDLFNDTCLTHFRNILRGRKKQTSLDIFFSKRPTGEARKREKCSEKGKDQ